jgi:UDPglucose 6-dehydrogenase
MEINRNQRRRVVMRLRKVLGSLTDKVIGVLGLSFKPDTDDIRESPAIEIIHLLQNEGAIVQAYDPQAMPAVERMVSGLRLCESSYAAAEGADALVLATEWNEFKHLDFSRVKNLMRMPIILDSRNLWEPEKLLQMGFFYYGIGLGFLNNRVPPVQLLPVPQYQAAGEVTR